MSREVSFYDRHTPKKAINLSVSSNLLRRERAEGLELSQVFERALESATRAARRARWLEDNGPAIEAYNEHVERDGVFSDEGRSL